MYLSCRIEKVGRTVDEICAATGGVVTRQDVWKVQGDLCRALGLVVGHVTPEEVVTRIGSVSKQSGEVIEKARQACRAVTAKEIAPTQPPQLVAAAVLVMSALVCNSQISLRDVSRATISCTVQQICKAYSTLHAYADLILSKEGLGGFDLALLPSVLVLGPDPGTRKKRKRKRKKGMIVEEAERNGNENQTEMAHTTTTTTSQGDDAWQAEVAKVARAAKVDESKPRTRANSIVDVVEGHGEDTEVVAPLFPKKRGAGRSDKAKKRSLGEASTGEEPTASSSSRKVQKVQKRSPLSPAESLVSLNSTPMAGSLSDKGSDQGSSTHRGDGAATATATAASYLMARSSSDPVRGTHDVQPVSHRSRQAALDALSSKKHASPLFRDAPKPTSRSKYL